MRGIDLELFTQDFKKLGVTFMESRMSADMIVMQYANKITELSKFVLDFIASERMRMTMRRFEESEHSRLGISWLHNRLKPTKNYMNA